MSVEEVSRVRAVLRETGLRQLRADEIYRPEQRAELIAQFGDDGAWLLLSLDHYSRRAQYDLAAALMESAGRGSTHQAIHFQAMADLQVQSSIYAVAEQFARLALACCAHEPATTSFFDRYMQRSDVVNLIQEMRRLGAENFRAALKAPSEVEAVRRLLRQAGQKDSRTIIRSIISDLDSLMASFAATAHQLGSLVEQPLVEGRQDLSQGHSLRRVTTHLDTG